MPRLSFRRKKPDAALAQAQAQAQAQVSSEPSSTSSNEPKDLWDRAYKLLSDDKDSKKLLDAYEKILLSELKARGASMVSLSTLNASEREEQLAAVVNQKVEAMEKDRWNLHLGSKTIEIKDRIIKAALFGKAFVSAAASADPHATLAWAGVCVLLPVSTF